MRISITPDTGFLVPEFCPPDGTHESEPVSRAPGSWHSWLATLVRQSPEWARKLARRAVAELPSVV